MDGRNTKGQFIKGHKSSGGRPRRSVDKKYLKTFATTVKKKDLKEILLTVMSRAKAGDMVAARIILEYGMGKPQQQVQVDVVSDLNIVLIWPEDADDHDSLASVA